MAYYESLELVCQPTMASKYYILVTNRLFK